MMRSRCILLPLALIVAGLVLVGVVLPPPAGAAPPALPPRPTLTPIPPTAIVTAGPTEPPPDTPVATAAPGLPTPLPTSIPTAVLPTAGVTGPAWPWLLLGMGLVVVGVVGLFLARGRK